MNVGNDNFMVVKEQVLYSQLRNGASFFRAGDNRLYIKKNRFIAMNADDYGGSILFIEKDGMVESSWSKQIKKGEIE